MKDKEIEKPVETLKPLKSKGKKLQKYSKYIKGKKYVVEASSTQEARNLFKKLSK
jgi:hypothetical protein